MDCIKCGDDPCTCQRGLQTVSSRQSVPQKYDFRQCTSPGCTVVIGFLPGSTDGLATCKWCNAGVAHV
jgi:hypothetical protein